MSIQDVSAEQLAKLFHHYHEALASNCEGRGYEARPSWEQTPQQERKLMVSAARLALLELAATPAGAARKYFATPGEAEWGC